MCNKYTIFLVDSNDLISLKWKKKIYIYILHTTDILHDVKTNNIHITKLMIKQFQSQILRSIKFDHEIFFLLRNISPQSSTNRAYKVNLTVSVEKN